MIWRTDTPPKGERVLIYMPAYMRRVNSKRFPVRDGVSVAEWWEDHSDSPVEGAWFFIKNGNGYIRRPVSHWMTIPLPDEEMVSASAATFAAAKAAAQS